jgi:hypothetical protein
MRKASELRGKEAKAHCLPFAVHGFARRRRAVWRCGWEVAASTISPKPPLGATWASCVLVARGEDTKLKLGENFTSPACTTTMNAYGL